MLNKKNYPTDIEFEDFINSLKKNYNLKLNLILNY